MSNELQEIFIRKKITINAIFRNHNKNQCKNVQTHT